MSIRLIISVATVVIFVILYFLIRWLLLSLSRKRKYKRVADKIKKKIKPLYKQKKGDKKYTISEYEECIGTTKDKNVKAWGRWLLAQFYHSNPHRHKDYLDNAIECYTHIMKEFFDYPFHEESLFRLGNLLFFEKLDRNRVCDVYQELLEKYPRSKWVTIARERVELIKNNLTYPHALNNYILAEKHFERGRYEKSIQSLLNIIEKYPQSGLVSEALYFLGDIYQFKLKDYSKAMDEYKNLIRDFPQNRFVANAQFKIAECCRKLEEWQEAIGAYRKFIKDYSQYGYSDYAQFYIGQCYEKLEDWRKAKDEYSLISTNYPESIWTDVARNRIRYLQKYLGG
ncbi:MAG: tetratricopeptide repeat protein [Elusimicrobiota bacterium]|nr:tetratricopeptide repeat protein [Elusimicrobiota bacterium]